VLTAGRCKNKYKTGSLIDLRSSCAQIHVLGTALRLATIQLRRLQLHQQLPDAAINLRAAFRCAFTAETCQPQPQPLSIDLIVTQVYRHNHNA
jgi:hypothetical protein